MAGGANATGSYRLFIRSVSPTLLSTLAANALNTQRLDTQRIGEGEPTPAPPADQFKRVWEDAVDQVFAQEPIAWKRL